jgi:hypothetical protein
MALSRFKTVSFSLLVVIGSACENVDTGVDPKENSANFAKYVAIGTSISMGYASDGVLAASQQASWPKLLANDLGVTFTLPLIDSPGCQPPYAAPLSQIRRIDNSLAVNTSIVCAANSAGVTLPAQNVAVTGQTTTDAFTVAPTSGKVAARVLPPNQTQVAAMRAQNPTFVSVELGAAEFLPALSGLLSENTTFIPIETFTASYGNVVDAVKQTGAGALLVTLPTDVTKIPVVRTSAEIASQRAAFLLLNVSVNSNCDTSPNFVTLPKVVFALFNGATRASSGLSPYDLSCADVQALADGILTPADVATLNALIAQMNAYITTKANENGYATMSLGVLYDTAKTGVPFDLATILTSTTPFGPNMSLDAVHPSAAGNAILAAAARAAITAKYGSITK